MCSEQLIIQSIFREKVWISWNKMSKRALVLPSSSVYYDYYYYKSYQHQH